MEKHIAKKLNEKRIRFLDQVETKAIFSIIGEKVTPQNEENSLNDLITESENEIDTRVIKRILMLLYLDK